MDLYRVDTKDGYNNIKDGIFRARRWNTASYPHEILKEKYKSLQIDEGIYRICFWTTKELAINSRDNDFKWLSKENYIHKCSAKLLIDQGFHQENDCGVTSGEAYLFWIIEKLDGNNEKFSNKGISLSNLEKVTT